MSCSNCGSNGLTSCSCNDNCPDKTSELTFDGTLTSIPIPDGATLNDVLLLLEEYVMNSIDALNFEYVISDLNCIGLPAGTYGYNQVFDAINEAICSISNELIDISDDIVAINNDITSIQGDITNIESDIINVESLVGDVMPIGSMIMYPVAAEPNSKWQICEGQSLSTTTYVDLFNVIGYNFGGFGTTFKVPDMRSKFLVGYDGTGAAEYQTIGQGAGANDVTLTSAESGMPDHNHSGATLGNGAHTHTFDINKRTSATGGSNIYSLVNEPKSDNDGTQVYPGFEGTTMSNLGNHTHTIPASGGTNAASAHENRPEFIVFPWMIKVLN